ncbi:hypothetical protein Nepgr_006227 [Nepenthes gracilis]|uniref:Uncharacterized protein n=1 Tax=Nepenthes gracilis TaxID=150966 RepID=A0AAD3S4Q7_NEPGR|nr:hypothetical protein Nepgr_006227 [Nepenthes gracilis]
MISRLNIISLPFIFSAIFFNSLSSVKNLDSPLPLAPALYVFGDSLFDSGNNNHLPTLARANYKPYGVDFAGGVTGRFTNGRTVADFIVKSELPHYFKSRKELSKYLSMAIFIFSVGNNDYINNYLDSGFDSSERYPPQQFSQLLIHSLSLKLQRLYELGARKIVVFELGPIGCIPSIAKKVDGKCDEHVNYMISEFNSGLSRMLQNLTTTLHGSFFILGHANWLGYDAITNPSKYGLTDSSNPCCETWFNGTLSCIPELTPCPSPYRHFFWDAYHLTEAACSVMASHCINGSSVCIPMNINQLIQV